MTNANNISRGQLFWRWALIIAEFLVVVFLIFVATIGGRENAFTHSTSVSIFGYLSGIALWFLLLGSPFLIRSQKRLAVAGCIISATAILLLMFFFR